MANKVFRGERLKEVRESRGLSQTDLEQLTGISNMQISRYESGKSEPTPEVIVKLANNLSITTDYLLGLVANPEDHLELQDLSPTEARLLAAFRRGDLRDAMSVFARDSSS
jgi:transcriptional regulator with XRE-family HTH domain